MSKELTGKKAPTFALPDAGGKTHKLTDYKGKIVVIYFYPKDNTPGCTKEACSFRDYKAEFDALGAIVFGISADSEQSHAKFQSLYSLNFPLLIDEGHAVAQKFGAYGEKKLYGKTSMGVIRSTFIIDRLGKIARQWNSVKVDGHVEKVLDAVKEIA